MVELYRRMKDIPGGVYMFAATFGNVHGSTQAGVVKLKPEILRQGQEAIQKAFGNDARFPVCVSWRFRFHH